MAAARQLVVPPKAGEVAPPFALDGSIWLLLAVNMTALALAYHQHWSLPKLMLLYWGQSIVIGISYVARIAPLDRSAAGFFVMHFGIFHVVYFVFIMIGDGKRPPPSLDAWFWLCMAAFALNHLWSYRYNRELDRQGTPSVNTLMFTPYVRIVPMHVTILASGFLGWGLLLFGALKILADVGMHLLEHAALQRVRGGAGQAGTAKWE